VNKRLLIPERLGLTLPVPLIMSRAQADCIALQRF